MARQPGSKVLASDGTRYFDYGSNVLDFDLNTTPRFFGSFTHSGPTFDESRAYGRGLPAASGRDDHIRLSARHNALGINVAYWDGHVGNMKMVDAWRDPNPWYPSGTVFNGDRATSESVEFMNDANTDKIW